MTDAHLKLSGSIIAIGVITAITSAIFYFMRLPIFDEIDLAWTITIGLVAAAIAALSLALRSIWDTRQ